MRFFRYMAERKGFEPLWSCPQTVFKSMRLLSTCLPKVSHSTEKIKATQGLLGLNDLKRNCSGRFEYYQHLSISLENPANRRDVRRDA